MLRDEDQILRLDGAGNPYSESSLFCLALNNPFRQSVIRFIRWPGLSDPSHPSRLGLTTQGAAILPRQLLVRYTRPAAGRDGMLAQRSLTAPPHPESLSASSDSHPATCSI